MITYIFTDGSSRGNPGPGGWGSVVVWQKESKGKNETHVMELGGRENPTTNNRMELRAVAEGLSHADKDADIVIYSDSKYVINGITSWIKGWKRNGWVMKTKSDVINKDLWMRIDESVQGRNVKWEYVGGHVGIIGNERCDHIATDFADEEKPPLYSGPIENYDLPNVLDVSRDESAVKAKGSSSSRAKAKAYSYISSVGGVIHVDHSWADCEKRVKGVKGARYKKSLDLGDEQKVIEEFEELL